MYSPTLLREKTKKKTVCDIKAIWSVFFEIYIFLLQNQKLTYHYKSSDWIWKHYVYWDFNSALNLIGRINFEFFEIWSERLILQCNNISKCSAAVRRLSWHNYIMLIKLGSWFSPLKLMIRIQKKRYMKILLESIVKHSRVDVLSLREQ